MIVTKGFCEVSIILYEGLWLRTLDQPRFYWSLGLGWGYPNGLLSECSGMRGAPSLIPANLNQPTGQVPPYQKNVSTSFTYRLIGLSKVQQYLPRPLTLSPGVQPRVSDCGFLVSALYGPLVRDVSAKLGFTIPLNPKHAFCFETSAPNRAVSRSVWESAS